MNYVFSLPFDKDECIKLNDQYCADFIFRLKQIKTIVVLTQKFIFKKQMH